MQRKVSVSTQIGSDSPEPLSSPRSGKEDAQLLTYHFWDQPEIVWEKALSARDAPISLAKFCQQLSKLEAHFGESLIKLGQEFKDAPFSEGPNLTKAWGSFIQQVTQLGEEFGHIAKSTQMMTSTSSGLLKKMENILDEPVKTGKTEIASSKKVLLEHAKIYEKAEKDVEKMKEHENAKKLKKQKSSRQVKSPRALTNSKPIKVWTGEDAWIEGLSDRKVIIAEALMAELKKTRAIKFDSETKHRKTLSNALARYQNVDKERVHTLRDVMYGTLSSHNTSLTAAYKGILTKMRKVKELTQQDDLEIFCAAHTSHKPCPWIQDARVMPKAANTPPAALEAKRMIAPKRSRDSEDNSARGDYSARDSTLGDSSLSKSTSESKYVPPAQEPVKVSPPRIPTPPITAPRKSTLNNFLTANNNPNNSQSVTPRPSNSSTPRPSSSLLDPHDSSFGSQAYFASLADVNKSATLTPMALWGRTHYLTAPTPFTREQVEGKQPPQEPQQPQQQSEPEHSPQKLEPSPPAQVQQTQEQQPEQPQQQLSPDVEQSPEQPAPTEGSAPTLLDLTKGSQHILPAVVASRHPSEMPPLIIDNGSAYFKAGFAGEQAPLFVVPSSIASFPHIWNPQVRAQFMGGSALHTGPELQMPPSYVNVNNSVFNDDPNWDDLEAAWEYLFARLTPNPADHYVLMTQPCMAPLHIKQTMEEILYEKFNIQGLYIAEAPLLSAYAYGQSSGLVVEVGHSSAQVVPVVDGYLLDAHVRRVKHLGGAQDTQRILDYFRENPEAHEAVKYPSESHVYSMAQSIKERLCACPLSKSAYEDEFSVCDDAKGFLGGQDPENEEAAVRGPQGPHSFTLQKALLMCGEVSFSPSDVLRDNDSSIVSIQQLCKQVVASCAVDVRNDLLANVFLSGQVTTMPGFEERLRQELRSAMPYAPAINVYGSAKRYAPWTGGSVLACIDDFKTEWRLRDEWEPER